MDALPPPPDVSGRRHTPLPLPGHAVLPGGLRRRQHDHEVGQGRVAVHAGAARSPRPAAVAGRAGKARPLGSQHPPPHPPHTQGLSPACRPRKYSTGPKSRLPVGLLPAPGRPDSPPDRAGAVPDPPGTKNLLAPDKMKFLGECLADFSEEKNGRKRDFLEGNTT